MVIEIGLNMVQLYRMLQLNQSNYFYVIDIIISQSSLAGDLALMTLREVLTWE